MVYDESLAKRVRQALKDEKNISEKKMFGGLAYLLDGKMSVGILSENLVVRIDPKEQDNLLKYPDVRPMDFTGRPMKGFIYVGPKATATGPALKSWLKRGLEYARSLPKKTEGKKK